MDLSEEHVGIASEVIGWNPRCELSVGDVLDISAGDGEFDEVIYTGGVLSHIQPEDRVRALLELHRVAKPGAPVLVSVMSRWGVFNHYGIHSVDELIREGYYETLGRTGENHDWRREGYYAHYYTTDEIRELVKDSPLQLESFLSLQGLTTGAVDEFNTLDRDSLEFRRWVENYCGSIGVTLSCRIWASTSCSSVEDPIQRKHYDEEKNSEQRCGDIGDSSLPRAVLFV